MKAMLPKHKLIRLKSINLDFCEDRVYEKQKKISFSKVKKSSKAEKLELVHTDVWGKASIPSLSTSLYFVIFIDDANRNV